MILSLIVTERHRRYQTPFSGIFRKDIRGEVMMFRITDMEIRILIGKAHRHRLAPMLPAPGIHMPVLQYIIRHPAPIVYVYHN